MPKRYRFKRKRGNGLKKTVYKNKQKIQLLSKAIEYKWFDRSLTNQDVNTVGVAHPINIMAQGTNVSTREGNKLLARRVTIRGHFHNNHGTAQDCVVRMLLIRARDQNNVAQTINLVLDPGVTNVHSMLRDAHKHRFQILLDKTFAMDTSQHSIIPFYFTHKCKTVCTYNANTPSVTDIEDGAYYLMTYSTVVGTTDDPRLDFTARFYYMDA